MFSKAVLYGMNALHYG